jgi:CDP-4-dehydro-6-deoxyglucose reductase
MSVTVTLSPSGHRFVVEDGETVLESALRSGLAPEYGCANGTCGECKTRVVSGEVREIRFHDYVIGAAEKRMGYTLLCSATAVRDTHFEAMEAARPEDIPMQKVRARVRGLERIGDDLVIVEIRIQRARILRFLAGQTVQLTLKGLGPKKLPVASCHCDGVNLQFHLSRDTGDAFSAHVFDVLETSDKLDVEGPWGSFTLHTDSERPILYFAYGTAFAPIKSIIEHAINLELCQPMHLYWCTPGNCPPYMHDYCRSLSDALDNLSYHTLAADAASSAVSARQIAADHPRIADYDVYVAGPDDFVSSASRVFLDRGLAQERLFEYRNGSL